MIVALVVGLGFPGASLVAADPAAIPARVACESLPSASDYGGISDAPTEISSATTVAATAGAPEFCDVVGIISPQIHFELKLPTTTWQGRFLQNGCGGYCGMIRSPGFPACDLQPGGDFAVAATDDGHTGAAVWALDDEQLRIDYGYRAVHALSVASKSIINTFYGVSPRYSYFNGCSDGGREALSEAQRFPDDFDGIVAGALEIYAEALNVEVHAWDAKANTDANGHNILTVDKLPALHAAVIAACDGADGLVDGQIDDPRACHFDPGTVQCPSGVDNVTCLTPAQVDTARKLYAGPHTPEGERLYPGALTYGSEVAWGQFVSGPADRAPQVASFVNGYLRYQGFPSGHLGPTLEDWDFSRQSFERLLPESSVYDATYANLSAFRDRGGKLLMYHGWADPGIPAEGTIAYFDALQQRMGGLNRTQEFARLFMIPTMFHCTGGYGPNQFDAINPIVHWVELGQAPDKLIVSGPSPLNPDLTRTRPVFTYPLRAVYAGKGNIDDATSFSSAAPTAEANSDLHWIGEFLYDRVPVSPLLTLSPG